MRATGTTPYRGFDGENVAMRRRLKSHIGSVARAVLGSESRLYQFASKRLREAQVPIQQVAELPTGMAVLAAEKAALFERVRALESHNEALTNKATELASELQKKVDLDYQLIMTQQNILAGLSDTEPQFLELYEHCRKQTMTSPERLYALYKSVKYIVANKIPGDIAETGVWLGGSCMLVAETLLRAGDSLRRILLYDTFEGHPEPDPERDIDLWDNRAHDEWERQQTSSGQEKWGYAALEAVRANMTGTSYPSDKLIFVKGKVEQTVPLNVPARLALLRLDTDWYESTKASLEYLYPKLVSGGVLIIDDYGHYKGQRQAVDEYFAALGEYPLFHRVDYSCRVMTKR